MSAHVAPGNIRDRIVALRRQRIACEGHGLGHPVPAERTAPMIPFGRDPFLICEIKRRSPSRGAIAPTLDPTAQARLYRGAGVESISVLTEEDHFGGSIADLMAVKRAFPDVSVLRKDFLVDEEDVVVSHLAGADAVLLIASLFDRSTFERVYARARSLGMEALVEVHDESDVAVVRHARPTLVGINSRNLATFAVDKLHPLRVRAAIDWPTRIVFESGIGHGEDIAFVRAAGFAGALVGESVTRDTDLAATLVAAFDEPARRDGFWTRLARLRPGWSGDTPGTAGTGPTAAGPAGGSLPVVKICGITNERDGRLAVDVGADILGFVFAESPRRADARVVRELAGLEVPKVAVVVARVNGGTRDRATLPRDVAELLEEGLIDAVQFHGDEEPEECRRLAFPYYKAVRLKDATSVGSLGAFRCPRVLVDAFSKSARGGTGVRIHAEPAARAAAAGPLWLAGGLSPDNIREVVTELHPELVDASSGLESIPGRKDPDKLRRFFWEIGNAFA